MNILQTLFGWQPGSTHKHKGARRKPKNWRLKRRRARKIAQASRRRNRSRR